MKSRVADFQRHAAPEVEQKDEAWFYDQLLKKCPEVYRKGSDFMIRCPFPPHIDNNPSCGVDRTSGKFHCWGCNVGGGWNKLAKQLGMEYLKTSRKHHRPYESADDDDKKRTIEIQEVADGMSRAFSKMGVKPHERERKGEINRPLVEPWPKQRGWRDVTGPVLANLGCVRVLDLRHNIERIGLPVRTPSGDLVGYTCRALTPADAEPKYSPLSADRITWREKELPASTSLFLVEKVLEDGWDRVVLVEGPYDALRLYSLGVPAIAILGTSNWTQTKAAIVRGLGLRFVGVMMDNDDAGRIAQLHILDTLLNSIRTRGFNLPAGVKDPGEMSEAQVRWLAKRIASI